MHALRFLLPLEIGVGRSRVHFDYCVTTGRYLCVSTPPVVTPFSYRKVDMGNLTCATTCETGTFEEERKNGSSPGLDQARNPW